MNKPENCCADGCGRPTRSHNVAIDVSEHDAVGLPTLAGVVCHRCWAGDSEDVPPIGDLYNDAAYDDEDGDAATIRLIESVDFEQMVSIHVPVEELV